MLGVCLLLCPAVLAVQVVVDFHQVFLEGQDKVVQIKKIKKIRRKSVLNHKVAPQEWVRSE